MGYGVNAAQFNANPGSFSQSSSIRRWGNREALTGQSYTPVARVVALVDANGNVNSTTGLYNIFNANNPRSAYTSNGSTIYVSGQGVGGDSTGGVFYTTLRSSSATSITGNDAGGGTSQDALRANLQMGNSMPRWIASLVQRIVLTSAHWAPVHRRPHLARLHSFPGPARLPVNSPSPPPLPMASTLPDSKSI